MTSLATKVKLYLEANSKTWEEEENNITVMQLTEDEGPFINEWNVSGLAQPTTSQLDALASDAAIEESNSRIRETRRKSYGRTGDQLDMLYKDMLADKGDKTGEWAEHVKAVKDANPKD